MWLCIFSKTSFLSFVEHLWVFELYSFWGEGKRVKTFELFKAAIGIVLSVGIKKYHAPFGCGTCSPLICSESGHGFMHFALVCCICYAD